MELLTGSKPSPASSGFFSSCDNDCAAGVAAGEATTWAARRAIRERGAMACARWPVCGMESEDVYVCRRMRPDVAFLPAASHSLTLRVVPARATV
eukprot:COSAG06_NODE_763_length_12486_cov_37.835244_6_plen_95_part_00